MKPIITDVQLTPAAAAVIGAFNALDAQTGGDDGVDYKRLYLFMFNGITDILSGVEIGAIVVGRLRQLQVAAEEMFCREDGGGMKPA